MNKKEIQASVRQLLDRGVPRSEVFARLSGQGMKDSRLAYFIASRVDPARREQHRGKVRVLVALMVVLALIGFVVGFGTGARIGPNAKWIFAFGIALLTLLFAWGFHAARVGFYNAYILLSIIQIPKSFEGFAADPLSASIGLAFNGGLLAFTWYVRHCLFPDFNFLNPRKVKGQYVFSA